MKTQLVVPVPDEGYSVWGTGWEDSMVHMGLLCSNTINVVPSTQF